MQERRTARPTKLFAGPLSLEPECRRAGATSEGADLASWKRLRRIPSYARAHAGVADYYVRLGLWGGVPPAESFAAAMVSARHAMALDPRLGDAHASLGFCLWTNDRDYDAAEREFNIAIAHSPIRQMLITGLGCSIRRGAARNWRSPISTGLTRSIQTRR